MKNGVSKLHTSPNLLFRQGEITVKDMQKKRASYAFELDGSDDWKILVDFDSEQIVFPPEILSTSERPDIIIWSYASRKVLLIELTCPAEEGIDDAKIRKETK